MSSTPAEPPDRIPGRATVEGTAAYASRLAARAGAGHFRRAQGLTLSSIGMGSYLGESDAADDERYRSATVEAVRLGCNHIDTAINYRFQRSERALGEALAEILRRNEARRDELVVASKGGYVPFDGAPPADAAGWFQRTFVHAEIAGVQDLVAGCHCMTPAYLEHQIGWSRRNLGLECLDVYYLHNPEQQLDEISRDLFRTRLRAAFERLEDLAGRGWLGFYGTATWNGYRAAAASRGYLSLQEVVETARQVAGEAHRFRFVQAPLNLAMPEALVARNQRVRDRDLSLAEAAGELGVNVVASASILQGRLARGLPASVAECLPGLPSDAQRALQFVRSAPGVASALVGMKRLEHVRENMALAGVDALGEREFRRAFL